ncbi:MAG: ATP-binding domain-containing protein, partial [Clostridia bacterium]|nr:ATP-binding domain-containing protein [Clostridia bacterium]
RDIDEMSDANNYASLMTIHAAKGLEFKCVFIVGLVEGLFPLRRAINSGDPNELEEERRLMYVAITRAKEKLYLTHPKTRFSFETKQSEYCIPSRFIKESSLDYIADLESSAVTRSKLEMNEIRSMGYARAATKVNIIKGSETIVPAAQPKNYNFSDFKKGTKVRHNHFGEGEVILPVTDFTSGFVTIRFDSVGIKTLSLKYANLEIIS